MDIMAGVTSEWIVEKGKEIIALYDDGFQYSDVWKTMSKVMEIVDQLEGLDGPKKKETAVNIINYVIDEVDIPWVPDSMVDPILKALVPDGIDYLHKASKGKFNF